MESCFRNVLCRSLVFILAALLAAGTAPAAAAGDREALVEGNNAFAVDLYGQLKKGGQGKSIFFSPVSISSALAMTYAGAKGETASQMAAALHFVLAPGRLHPAFAELLGGLKGGKDFDLAVANAVWAQRGFAFHKSFLGIAGKYYQGALRKVDFLRDPGRSLAEINRWAEEKTNGKITGLLNPGNITRDTRLVLTSAVYFKGSWESRFDPKETRMEPFTLESGKTVQVQMMSQKGEFGLSRDENSVILKMPYAGGKLSMVIMMPLSGKLEVLENSFLAGGLRARLSSLPRESMRLQVPKFQMTDSFNLNEPLISLGMRNAFDDKADFSGMTRSEKLFISAVRHKAFVDVNEEGTEAAAATAVVIGTLSAREMFVQINRPFIFMIRDEQSGSILFLGRMMDPSEKS